MAFYNFTKISGSEPLFRLLEGCRGIKQHPVWHPEGDVFSHQLQVLQHAFRESEDIDLIVAAMLHDVGKQIEKLGHEKYSVQMLEGHVSGKTLWLVGNHMRYWGYATGEMKKLSKVKEMASHKWLPDLIQVCRWDRMGRIAGATPEYHRASIIEKLRQINGET